MALRAQGSISPIEMPGSMQGVDSNGNTSDDSVIYRGRPYCLANALDMALIDATRERYIPGRARGARVVAAVLQTSRLPTSVT